MFSCMQAWDKLRSSRNINELNNLFLWCVFSRFFVPCYCAVSKRLIVLGTGNSARSKTKMHVNGQSICDSNTSNSSTGMLSAECQRSKSKMRDMGIYQEIGILTIRRVSTGGYVHGLQQL